MLSPAFLAAAVNSGAAGYLGIRITDSGRQSWAGLSNDVALSETVDTDKCAILIVANNTNGAGGTEWTVKAEFIDGDNIRFTRIYNSGSVKFNYYVIEFGDVISHQFHEVAVNSDTVVHPISAIDTIKNNHIVIQTSTSRSSGSDQETLVRIGEVTDNTVTLRRGGSQNSTCNFWVVEYKQ